MTIRLLDSQIPNILRSDHMELVNSNGGKHSTRQILVGELVNRVEWDFELCYFVTTNYNNDCSLVTTC